MSTKSKQESNAKLEKNQVVSAEMFFFLFIYFLVLVFVLNSKFSADEMLLNTIGISDVHPHLFILNY